MSWQLTNFSMGTLWSIFLSVSFTQTPKLQPGDCEGQVRVHINLIRPVRMVLTARPPSIFDVVGGGDDDGDDPSSEEEASNGAQQLESVSSVRLRGKMIGRITSFRLPRGSSKLLHVHLWVSCSLLVEIASCRLSSYFHNLFDLF